MGDSQHDFSPGVLSILVMAQVVCFDMGLDNHSLCCVTGDILGLLLDIDNKQVTFALNGNALPSYNQLFAHARWVTMPARLKWTVNEKISV